MLKVKNMLLLLLLSIVFCFAGCGSQEKIVSWNVEDYSKLEDIISIEESSDDEIEEILTYKIRYKCDDCEVVSYLSVPSEFLENKEAYPCIIFARGGNREYGASTPKRIAQFARGFGTIVFSSQYRGVDGGTGMEEFGGADVNDVLKLIDLCEKFAFVDMEELYMLGVSRGGMMTYQVIRQDERVKKAVVVSGAADMFMTYEERSDMRTVCKTLIGGTPEDMPDEYEKRSATYWADELKCPVLIIHSEQDQKVSYTQAEKMVEKLGAAGMEYDFLSHEDDVHGLRSKDFAVIAEWLKEE